jgi:hypothetical protein
MFLVMNDVRYLLGATQRRVSVYLPTLDPPLLAPPLDFLEWWAFGPVPTLSSPGNTRYHPVLPSRLMSVRTHIISSFDNRRLIYAASCASILEHTSSYVKRAPCLCGSVRWSCCLQMLEFHVSASVDAVRTSARTIARRRKFVRDSISRWTNERCVGGCSMTILLCAAELSRT